MDLPHLQEILDFTWLLAGAESLLSRDLWLLLLLLQKHPNSSLQKKQTAVQIDPCHRRLPYALASKIKLSLFQHLMLIGVWPKHWMETHLKLASVLQPGKVSLLRLPFISCTAIVLKLASSISDKFTLASNPCQRMLLAPISFNISGGSPVMLARWDSDSIWWQ